VIDLVLLQEQLDHSLRARHAANPEVAEERLARDVGHLDLSLETGLLHLVAGVEQELIGRTEATGALGGADHQVPRFLQEPLPPNGGLLASPRVVWPQDTDGLDAYSDERERLIPEQAER
jgi:hypothetical protein